MDGESARAGLQLGFAAALVSSESGRAHELRVEVLAFGYPAPVAVRGPPFLPIVPEVDEEVGRVGQLRGVRYWFELKRPAVMALASDGMLQRLGAGDEQAGRRAIRLALQRKVGGQNVGQLLGGAGKPEDDESVLVATVGGWDDTWKLHCNDREEVRRMMRQIHTRIARELSRGSANRLIIGVGVAIENVIEHSGTERFQACARFSTDQVCVEIIDEGIGFAKAERIERGLDVVQHLCPASYVRKNKPTGTVVGIVTTARDHAE